MAADVGKKLLQEVEEVGLGEVSLQHPVTRELLCTDKEDLTITKG